MRNTTLQTILILFLTHWVQAQTGTFVSNDIFQDEYLIENKGQFNKIYTTDRNIHFGAINKGNEFFIRPDGFSFHLQKAVLKEEYRNLNAKDLHEIEERTEAYYREKIWLDCRWIGANPNAKWELLEKSPHYFSYGDKEYNSYGYKKLIQKNIYAGVNLIYEIHPRGGLKYSLEVLPGADISQIQFEYQNADDVVLTNQSQSLLIDNPVIPLYERGIKAYYSDGTPINFTYQKTGKIISFGHSEKLNLNRRIIIDPWVTANTSLSGIASANNKAYDVDYDAEGNLFVIGGGGQEGTTTDAYPKIAKYDVNGNLLWTFNGVIPSISWNSSPGQSNYARVGNLTVDKASGKTYMSQGLHVLVGVTMIRLDPAGNYDGFATIPDPDFLEVWEMKLNCSKDEIVGMGGGTSSDINFGLVDPVSGIVTISNGTGLPGIAQDMVCATIGVEGDIYSVFSSGGVQNKIFKINATYNGNLWNTATGFNTYSEQMNKPHVSTFAFSNGHNGLHASRNYLFYYDGAHLACFDKSTGASIGNTYNLTGQTAIWEGGIYANDCDEVFVGGNNGEILKFKFDGTNFNSLSAIPISNQTGHSTYDIVHNPLNDLLYACGDQFVATISTQSNCISGSHQAIDFNINTSCSDTAFAIILNGDPANGYSFIWTDSATNNEIKKSDNLPGDMDDWVSGLQAGTTYKLTVIYKQPCQVVSSYQYFSIHEASDTTTHNYQACPGETIILPDGTSVTNSGTYYSLYKNTDQCDSIIENKVVFLEELCPCKFEMPNAFSPNGDQNNEKIKPLLICENSLEQYEFIIANRYGQIVFKTDDIHTGWDGKLNGESQGIGVFYYYIHYKVKGINQEKELRGDITLLK